MCGVNQVLHSLYKWTSVSLTWYYYHTLSRAPQARFKPREWIADLCSQAQGHFTVLIDKIRRSQISFLPLYFPRSAVPSPSRWLRRTCILGCGRNIIQPIKASRSFYFETFLTSLSRPALPAIVAGALVLNRLVCDTYITVS